MAPWASSHLIICSARVGPRLFERRYIRLQFLWMLSFSKVCPSHEGRTKQQRVVPPPWRSARVTRAWRSWGGGGGHNYSGLTPPHHRGYQHEFGVHTEGVLGGAGEAWVQKKAGSRATALLSMQWISPTVGCAVGGGNGKKAGFSGPGGRFCHCLREHVRKEPMM